MVQETNIEAEVVAEAAEKQAEAAVEAAKTATKPARRAAKAARKGAGKPRRKTRPTSKKAQVRAQERNDAMKFDPANIFAGFGAFPGAAAFEKFFTEAAERSEEAVKRSRKAAEEFADIYRGNIDAFVEAGRIATAGAQSIGRDIAAKGRDSIEQTANTVRSLAEAKNPTEFLQVQSDFARTAFDRFVEDSSALTESVVKLAGEAFQPISNRASANIERLNDIAA